MNMKAMKMIGMFVVTAAFLSAILVSCETNDDAQKNSQFTEQEIQFGITPIFSDNLKNGGPGLDGLPECSEEVPDYAEIKVKINGSEHTFTPDVFEINGQWYTEVFKLQIPTNSVQEVTLTQFIIYDYNDNQIQATPTETSPYASFVDNPVGDSFTFVVTGIEKKEVAIEVLCYNEAYYADFGFYWFAFEFTEVNELNFFGDLCTKYFEDYAENDDDGYGQLNDPKFDLPAIFRVEVYDASGDELITYDNRYMLDDGTIDEPLAVYYPNDLDEEGDTYTLKLYVRLKVGNAFDWVEYQTIHVDGDTGDLTFPDGSSVPDYGDDGVVDFVIGECAYYETEDDPMRPDIEFAPYMNLPETANITISHPYDDIAYWKVEVHTVNPAAGYDFGVGIYGGWCADADETINPGTRDYEVFSSLYPSQWPACTDNHIETAVINKINHLYNFLQNKNIDYSWQAFQLAVWKLRGQTYPSHQANVFGGFDTEADQLIALQTWEHDYMPLPGGYAAVLLNYDCTQQLIFVQVDP
ncbi:MAG: hypothetical protein R6U66_08475 [Bacteroidales bacterium]